MGDIPNSLWNYHQPGCTEKAMASSPSIRRTGLSRAAPWPSMSTNYNKYQLTGRRRHYCAVKTCSRAAPCWQTAGSLHAARRFCFDAIRPSCCLLEIELAFFCIRHTRTILSYLYVHTIDSFFPRTRLSVICNCLSINTIIIYLYYII